MKENLKNQGVIFLLLILMIGVLFTGVYILVIDIFWLIKMFVLLSMIILSILLFVLMKRVNKKLVYIEKKETLEITDTVDTVTNKKRCPKCYNLYDGQICFVCGYEKENNA